MSTDNPSANESDQRDAELARVLETYLADVENGCAVDPEQLIAAHPELADRLRSCLSSLQFVKEAAEDISSTGVAAMPSHIDTTLGDYRIHREIGRGGMGVVYEAEQVSLDRRVALKVLPFAAVMDPRQLVRFKNEAHAAACLTHQNIVPVYSVGCERGVHYYAMQYVEGPSLAQVIRHLRQTKEQDQDAIKAAAPQSDASTDPVAALSTEHSRDRHAYFRSVALLGIQAAEALDHAHQRGIIHRDVKPANLLLDVTGNLWVTDFGLARLESDASMTLTGDLVGTVRYMSPEQALAKRVVVDCRTDVYSLGVTLYELLALEPAYPGDDRQELLRQITLDEPRRVRKIDPAIPTELETILLKAVEKRPEDRYETAQELADDLRRFLDDKPIVARRPTLIQRASKWSRRHRTIVTSAVCIAVIFLVATTFVALSQRELARRDRELAQRRLQIQREINDALTDVARLRGGTRSADLGDDESFSLARERMLRVAALAETGPVAPEEKARVQELLNELDQEHRDQQLLRALDEAWLAQADSYSAQRRWAPEKCIPILSKDLEARGLRVGETRPTQAAAAITPLPESVRARLLVALEEWAHCRKLSPGTLLRSVDEEGMDSSRPPETTVRLRDTDRIVAIGYGRDGQITETGDKVLTRMGRHLSPAPGTIVRLKVIHWAQLESRTYEIVPDPILAWLRAVINTVDTDPWRQRMRKVYDLTERAEVLAAFEKLADEADVESQPVRVLTRLSDELQYYDSIDRAVELSRRIQRNHPSDVEANMNLALLLTKVDPPQLEEAARYYTAAIALRPDSACNYLNLGFVFSSHGKKGDAISQYREALRVQPDFLQAAHNLYVLFAEQGRRDEGIAGYRKFLQANPENAKAHYNLGTVFLEQGDMEEAIEQLRQAVQLDPNQSPIRLNLAWALSRQGKFEDAVSHYREAVRIVPADMRVRCLLGDALKKQGKLDEAMAAYSEALRIRPNYADAHARIGDVLATQGKPEEAVAEYRKGLEIKPDSVEAHFSLGNFLESQGKIDEALAEFREAVRLRPSSAAIHNAIGNILRKQGKPEDAIEAFHEAIRLAPIAPEPHSNLGIALIDLGEIETAITEFREAIRIQPNYSLAHSNLAWLLATSADPKWRQPEQALEHATKAVTLPPEHPECWTALGIAHYRNCHWKEAIGALEKSLESGSDEPTENWLFLAMAHWQLGNEDESRQWYEKAAQWMTENEVDEELLRFRTEADELLGVTEADPDDQENTEAEPSADQTTEEEEPNPDT